MSALKPSVQEQLNKQIHTELSASHLYLAASIWFEKANYKGIAKYLFTEGEEERVHAKSIIDYVLKREDGDVKLATIESPKIDSWERPVDVFNSIHAAEVANLESLEQLIQLAKAENDHSTEIFVADLIRDQVDGVDKSRSTLAKVKAYGALHGLMYHLDEMI